MSENEIDFDTILCATESNDTFSFLQGFLEACKLFGIWKDGEQYLGSSGITVREVKKQINLFTQGNL